MNTFLFFSVFAILGLFYLVFGYKAAQKLQNLDDYFLADRNLGILSLSIALIAVHFGGGVIVGTSNQSFYIGLYSLAYIVGISVGFILLAAGIASRMQALGVTTIAEVFVTRYRSQVLKIACSLFSIISLTGILLAQMVGTRNIMHALQLYSPWLFIAFWAIIIGYTMAGGLSAIVKSNVFQIIFMASVFILLFLYEAYTDFAHVKHAFSQPDIFSVPDIFSTRQIITIILMPACYTLIEQDIAQNIFAARTQRIAIVSALIASIFMLAFSCIPAYFGMKARLLSYVVPEGANPLLYFFDQQYSPFIVVLAVYGIFAASISTADTILCAITSHIITDFRLRTPTNLGNVRLAQVMTLIMGMFTLIASFYAEDVISILTGSYMIPVATVFVPLVVTYFTRRVSTAAAYTSVILGGVSLPVLYQYPVIESIPPAALALTISAVGYMIVWYISGAYGITQPQHTKT